jgi:hypothetical protein
MLRWNLYVRFRIHPYFCTKFESQSTNFTFDNLSKQLLGEKLQKLFTAVTMTFLSRALIYLKFTLNYPQISDNEMSPWVTTTVLSGIFHRVWNLTASYFLHKRPAIISDHKIKITVKSQFSFFLKSRLNIKTESLQWYRHRRSLDYNL